MSGLKLAAVSETGEPLPDSGLALKYDFLAPPRILFGWGRRREAGTAGQALGRRAFIISGSRTLETSGAIDELQQSLGDADIEPVRLATISHEPLVSDVDGVSAAIVDARGGAGDFVVGIGGGSAIDLAKAVAAMATNRESSSVADYLEGVGAGLNISQPPLPLLAIPTTAGTGSEATKNAVISSYDPPYKKSLRSDLMIPRVVIVDPELTVTVPPSVTAQTGMDAITQLIESYLSRRAQPIPRALAAQGLQLALQTIGPAVLDGSLRHAREAMAHAALLSGMALANSGLGMAHGVAAALGVHHLVPHGLACAVTLPIALRANRAACEKDLGSLVRALTPGVECHDDEQASLVFVDSIQELCDSLHVPRRLSALGVQADDLPKLVAASRGNSMSGNPRELSDAELLAILEEAL